MRGQDTHYASLVYALTELVPIKSGNQNLDDFFIDFLRSIEILSSKDGTPTYSENPFKDKMRTQRLAELLAEPAIHFYEEIQAIKSLACLTSFVSGSIHYLDDLYTDLRLAIKNEDADFSNIRTLSLRDNDTLSLSNLKSCIAQNPTGIFEKSLFKLIRALEEREYFMSDEVIANFHIESDKSDVLSTSSTEEKTSKYWSNYYIYETQSTRKKFTTPEINAISRKLITLSITEPYEAAIDFACYGFGMKPEYILTRKLLGEVDEHGIYIDYIPPKDSAKAINTPGFIEPQSTFLLPWPSQSKKLISEIIRNNELQNITLGELLELDHHEVENNLRIMTLELSREFPAISYFSLLRQFTLTIWLNTGDIALVYVLKNSNHLQATTENYYIQYELNYLIKVILDAHEILFEEPPPIVCFDSTERIGCNSTVDLTTVKSILKKRKQKVSRLVNTASSPEELVNAFNEYSLYLATIFITLTASRLRNQLFTCRISLIPELNIAFINDKATFHFPNERPTVYPDCLKSQLTDFLNIREQVLKTFKNKLTIPLFFLIKDEKVIFLCLKDLKESWGQDENMLHRLRASNRSWLTKHGLPTEFIRILMGHGTTHYHPFGINASYSMQDWSLMCLKALNHYSKLLEIDTFITKHTVIFRRIRLSCPPIRVSKIKLADIENNILDYAQKSLICDNAFIKREISLSSKKNALDSLNNRWDNHNLNQRILNRVLRSAKNDGYRLHFSLPHTRNKESAPYGASFCYYLTIGFKLSKLIADTLPDELSKSEKEVYQWLKSIIFEYKFNCYGTSHIRRPALSQWKGFCIKHFSLKQIRISTVINAAKALSTALVPGAISCDHRKSDYQTNQDPVYQDLKNSMRPELNSLNSTSEKSRLNVTFKDIKSAQREVLQAIKIASKKKSKKNTLIHLIKEMVARFDGALVIQKYLEWLLDIAINGRIKSNLVISTIRQYSSIAAHLDRVWSAVDFEKTSKFQALVLFESYLRTPHGNQLADLRNVVLDWFNFSYFSVISHNALPSKIRQAKPKNILFDQEYIFLSEKLLENCGDAFEGIEFTKLFALYFGVKGGLRREEVQEVSSQDIQLFDGTVYLRVKRGKSTSAARVIMHSNLNETESILLSKINALPKSQQSESIMMHLCKTQKCVNEVFSELTQFSKAISGDIEFRNHHFRRSDINTGLESIFSPKMRLFPFREGFGDARRFGHANLSVSLGSYSVCNERLLQKYTYILPNGWSDYRTANVTGLKIANVRQRRCRARIPACPLSISELIFMHTQYDHCRILFNEIDISRNEIDLRKMNFSVFVIFALSTTKQFVHYLTRKTKDKPLQSLFVTSSIQISSTIKGLGKHSMSRVAKSAEELDETISKLSKTKDASKTLRYIEEILSSNTSANKKINLSPIKLRDFNYAMDNLGLSKIYSTHIENQSYVVNMGPASHTLKYPKDKWAILKLAYLYMITGENK
mgnify:CR=1 FL=1